MLMNLCRSFFDRQELAYDAEDAVLAFDSGA